MYSSDEEVRNKRYRTQKNGRGRSSIQRSKSNKSLKSSVSRSRSAKAKRLKTTASSSNIAHSIISLDLIKPGSSKNSSKLKLPTSKPPKTQKKKVSALLMKKQNIIEKLLGDILNKYSSQ